MFSDSRTRFFQRASEGWLDEAGVMGEQIHAHRNTRDDQQVQQDCEQPFGGHALTCTVNESAGFGVDPFFGTCTYSNDSSPAVALHERNPKF